MKKSIALYLVFFLVFTASFGQEQPFEAEVRQLSQRLDSLGWSSGETVFTGSSTIKLWRSLPEITQGQEVLNTGFGGSKAADLERHLFPLVLKFDPKRVFIYEGDNDLWAGVEPEEILASLDRIVTRIQIAAPNTKIYLIGAKPSPSRWSKKDLYQSFNKQLEKYSKSKEGVSFIDTWATLTDSAGNARPELYIQDQLHLNVDGYVLWNGIFRSYFN
ncbi:MAG: GDSL-type esterase/lipase family protein [Bacteroidetes bacterium]|nr:GDSL-type esterase/lipase family protein [Bacteroidota bacterium]